jgi:hypothetical protein
MIILFPLDALKIWSIAKTEEKPVKATFMFNSSLNPYISSWAICI